MSLGGGDRANLPRCPQPLRCLGLFHDPLLIATAILPMTYQKTAEYQRMIHLALDPYKAARAITAAQFRPEEKADNAIERDNPEPTAD